jgi:hypothetical protein
MKCVQCGRELTDPESIRREIGPVCLSHVKREGKKQELLPEERILTADMGGEIADLIAGTSGKSFQCIGGSSGHVENVGTWYGYPHSGGIADSAGKKWWAYQKCTISNYETAWWKVEKRIRKLNVMEVTQ